MTETHAHTHFRRRDPELVPRVMVRAVGVLVLSVLLLVTLYRLTETPVIATPPKGGFTVSHDILLSGDLSGAATVSLPDGTPVANLSPQDGGFVSGVWRVILRERTKHRVPLDGPVTLIGHDTGRISIHDPSTGWSADLMGFGADNARAFARLLAQLTGGQ